MSTRVMSDGATYDRTTCREPRKRHKPDPDERGYCRICGVHTHLTTQAYSRKLYPRHDPDTFWSSR